MPTLPDPARAYPLLIGDDLVAGSATPVGIRGPYDGTPVGRAAAASRSDVVRAIDAAAHAAPQARAMPSHARAEVLQRIHDAAAARREELAVLLALEAGKPIKQARLEVDRMLFIFRDDSAEAMRIGGEVMPLDRMPCMKHGSIVLGRHGQSSPFMWAVVGWIIT